MQLLRFADLHNNKNQTPSIVTIGNFDGMHLGHQYIINHVQRLAKTNSAKATVVTFEPQPKEFFLKEAAPLRITPFRDKIQAFKALNIDQVLCLQFNQKLAMLSAETFVKMILVGGLNAQHIIIGDDFRFGYQRQGDFKLLKDLGQKYGFSVESLPSYTLDDTRISSSHIRQLLNSGQFNDAAHFLGHSYSLSGRVHHGDQNGRKIGFPTINIPMPTAVVVSGVYVVNVHVHGKTYHGIANIGIRPTVGGRLRLLETHIFDFTHDLYGQYVTIEFLHFVRSEKKFANFDALKAQINDDKLAALMWLEKHTTKI
ncbi:MULTISPECIES: bifunctional riboflavin kinase/FAD synthetase [Cysteiniphilum]|uniref:Riboflavin biosynthesis protein n=1 Tax=Cysteiniphilum litorale TaxID=2056700 RepID=A0A8J2Z436_9GAMM|nr:MULTISPECIES: bifunctional riboflavin kinase/FAD synthetase [Cysteiniphilum]GGF96013.1 riboflavin biosynthesis protein [Cysteiniphilum litorale]